MTVLRYDTVLRAVRNLAVATPDIQRARRDARHEACLERIREACLDALGMEFDTLVRFDAASVVGLFSDPAQVRVLARLVDERARLLTERGEVEAGLSDSAYAWQLFRCSRRRFGVLRDARAAELVLREAGEPTPLE